mgnify:CR=1 FL=1
MTITKAIKASLFFVAISFTAPVSAQVVTDIVLLTAPEETEKSISYEKLVTLDPATPLEVFWSDNSITQMTAAALIEWFASQE